MSAPTETKPKIVGGRGRCDRRRNFANGGASAVKSDYKTKTAGLEEDTCDVGEARFAAKFQKTTDNIALYVQREYTDGASVAFDMKTMIATMIVLPSTPASGASDAETFIWKEEYKEAKKKKNTLEANNKKAFALIYGQCSPKLISKIKASNLWEQANKDQDVVQLLKII